MTDPVSTVRSTNDDDIVQQRRRKLEELRARGIEPYPTTFARTMENAAAVARFDELAGREVSVAGRVVSRRIMGKVSFCHLVDGTGRIQLLVREAATAPDQLAVGPEQYETFRDLYDIGDIVGATGRLMKTRTGEISVDVSHLTFLAKALRPLPEKWHGLTDVEKRYRQRYLDLIANEKVRRIFQIRSATVSALRRFLESRGFIEIETPVLQPLYGGAMARPFTTYHNELERELYLRIATELYLKRGIVGGIDKVFEIGRVFRNEGIDTTHNPEYTLLESYQAYASYLDVMEMVEAMVPWVAQEVLETTTITYAGHEIDLRPPWRRLTLRQAILDQTGIDVEHVGTRDELYRRAAGLGLPIQPTSSRGKIIDELLSAKVEPTLIQPTFLVDYPVELSPLAKRKPSAPHLVERFEAYVGGMEIANAFTELNDSVDQRARFMEQAELRALGDQEAHVVDDEFIETLEHGMPPTGGLGMGVDRLVMLLTDQTSIREVILFPTRRSSGP
jgi:lysyl-tRNA synthetase class 2